MKDINPFELAFVVIVCTLCLAFMSWVSVSLYELATAPYQPPQPTVLEQQIQACKDSGGVPYIITKEYVEDNYQDYLERCDKPAQ